MNTNSIELGREITNLKYKLVNKLQEWKKREYSDIIINYLEQYENILLMFYINQITIVQFIDWLRCQNRDPYQKFNFDYNDPKLRELLSFLISL